MRRDALGRPRHSSLPRKPCPRAKPGVRGHGLIPSPTVQRSGLDLAWLGGISRPGQRRGSFQERGSTHRGRAWRARSRPNNPRFPPPRLRSILLFHAGSLALKPSVGLRADGRVITPGAPLALRGGPLPVRARNAPSGSPSRDVAHTFPYELTSRVVEPNFTVWATSAPARLGNRFGSGARSRSEPGYVRCADILTNTPISYSRMPAAVRA